MENELLFLFEPSLQSQDDIDAAFPSTYLYLFLTFLHDTLIVCEGRKRWALLQKPMLAWLHN